MLPGPGNVILPLIQLESKRLPVIDANLSEEEQLEVTKNQNKRKGCSVGEELQEQPASKIPKVPRNEKLSEPLMQLKGKRSPVRDANLSEDMQFEMNQKLSELKRRTKPKRHGIGEELQRQPAIKIIREPGDEKLSEPLVQLGGKRLPVLDANLSAGKQVEKAHEQSQRKRERIGEELQGQAAIKVPTDLGNEELLEPLMQLEGETLPVPDANLSGEKQFELTEKQSQPKRHGAGEEHLGQRAINVLPNPGIEKLSGALMQLEGERCPVPDANQSEGKQFELTEKLSQFKRQSKPKKNGISEEHQGWSTIKVVQEPGSEKLSESLMQLEGERLPVPNANLIEEKRSQPKRHDSGEERQEQPAIKVLREPGNEKLLESSMQMEGERLPIPDANMSEEVEEVQFEMNQKLSQLKRCGSGEELQEKTGIKILPEPRNEKLSEPYMQLECEALPVPDANAAEEKQFELTKKLSQLKRHSRGGPRGSRNTESNRAVRSGINQPSQWKRKTEKANTEPIRASKLLAGVTADPNSKCGTGKQSSRANAEKIDQPESTVPKESEVSRSHNEDALLTDELQEKLESLKLFVEQASQEKQADQPQPTVSKYSDAGCLPNQKDTPITNELLERLERLKPSVEQASLVQQAGQPQPTVPKDSDACCWSHPSDSPDTDQLQEKFRRLKPFAEQNSIEQPVHPLASTPFADSWLDPCIEFAFKTLTSDFPILEDVSAIQDYFNNQPISSKSPNAGAGSIQLAMDCPSLGNGKVHRNCQQNRGMNH